MDRGNGIDLRLGPERRGGHHGPAFERLKAEPFRTGLAPALSELRAEFRLEAGADSE